MSRTALLMGISKCHRPNIYSGEGVFVTSTGALVVVIMLVMIVEILPINVSNDTRDTYYISGPGKGRQLSGLASVVALAHALVQGDDLDRALVVLALALAVLLVLDLRLVFRLRLIVGVLVGLLALALVLALVDLALTRALALVVARPARHAGCWRGWHTLPPAGGAS